MSNKPQIKHPSHHLTRPTSQLGMPTEDVGSRDASTPFTHPSLISRGRADLSPRYQTLLTGPPPQSHLPTQKAKQRKKQAVVSPDKISFPAASPSAPQHYARTSSSATVSLRRQGCTQTLPCGTIRNAPAGRAPLFPCSPGCCLSALHPILPCSRVLPSLSMLQKCIGEKSKVPRVRE